MKCSRGSRTWHRWLAGVLAAGIVLLVSIAVAAENPYKLKSGASGTLCLECHVDFQDTLQLPHVHTPVRSGNCADCHDPHASRHGKLLAESADQICAECHDDIGGGAPVSAHLAVLEGECSSCHDPHASEHANILRRSGNELCAECHGDVVDKVTSARFGHAPARDDCLTCHDPHSSEGAGFLLAESEPALCVTCHDSGGRAFRERHMEYPVDRGRCTSCHDPHGSDEGGILWATVHRPVVNRMCKQCHGDPGAPDALEATRSGIELCRGCHNGVVNQALAARQLHWPVADRVACLNCHSPHASAVSGLLVEPSRSLCGNCHGDVVARGARSVVPHEPVNSGDCVTCHAPHGSDNMFLLESADSIELCGTCHDWQSHSSHPIGKDVIDQRNPNLEVDCTSCHRSHGSPHKHLASFDPESELCIDCHETFRR